MSKNQSINKRVLFKAEMADKVIEDFGTYHGKKTFNSRSYGIFFNAEMDQKTD